jgi:hypothetical protein
LKKDTEIERLLTYVRNEEMTPPIVELRKRMLNQKEREDTIRDMLWFKIVRGTTPTPKYFTLGNKTLMLNNYQMLKVLSFD